MLFALLCGVYMYNYLVHTLVAAALLCAQYHVRLLVVLSHMYVDLVFWEDQSQAVHLSRLVALLCVVYVHITHTYVQLLGTYLGGGVTTWYLAKINLKQSTCPMLCVTSLVLHRPPFPFQRRKRGKINNKSRLV